MIAYMILTENFLEISVKNCIVGMLFTCPIDLNESAEVELEGGQ